MRSTRHRLCQTIIYLHRNSLFQFTIRQKKYINNLYIIHNSYSMNIQKQFNLSTYRPSMVPFIQNKHLKSSLFVLCFFFHSRLFIECMLVWLMSLYYIYRLTLLVRLPHEANIAIFLRKHDMLCFTK